ncbi:MAG: hypothetical protein AAGF23_11185, partial [Acidobacteriota bacterium]
RSALATLNAICDDPAEPLGVHVPDAPATLTDLVHQLMAKRADGRPAGGAREVVERLRRVHTALGGEPGPRPSTSWAPPPRSRPARGVALTVAGLLVAAAGLGALLLNRGSGPGERAGEPLRLIVTPLLYRGIEDHRYFAQGLGEEIRARLSTLDSVLVISGLAEDAGGAEVGPVPAVDYRLSGSVSWPGDGGPVAVTLRLDAERGGDPPWEHIFEEPPTDLLALQAKLAGDVARQLPIHIGDLDRRAVQLEGTSSQAAYLAYLEGLDWEGRSRFAQEYVDRALGAYRRAVEEDGRFVDARARAIRCRTLDYLNRARSPEEARDIHRQLDALEQLAPDATATRLAAAEVAYRVDGDHLAAVQGLAGVLADEPNHAVALATLGYVQRRRGELDAALDALGRAAEIEPFDAAFPAFIAETYRADRRFEPALRWYRKSLQIAPGDAWTRGQAALTRFELDPCTDTPCDGDGALDLLGAAPDPDDEAIRLHRFWLETGLAGDDPGRLAAAYDRLPRDPTFEEPAYDLVSFPSRAGVLYQLGRRDELRLLARRMGDQLRAATVLDPEYPTNHCLLAFALAIDDAAPDADTDAERHWRDCLHLAAADRFSGPRAREIRAMALVLSERADEAVPWVRALLDESYQRSLTRRALRQDPLWAALRRLPEGASLIAASAPGDRP